MKRAFLVPDEIREKDGSGPVMDLEGTKGLCSLTLGVTHVVEQESLEVGVYGSADGTTWDKQPLATFSQKFYVGTSTLVLDLDRLPHTAYLMARWKMLRWGRGSLQPRFGFYVFLAADPVGEATGR